MAGDPYSRLVSILRIGLPLLALAILSTLFLVSEQTQTGNTIPFADSEVRDRIREQRISGPVFEGVTSGGDRISVAAKQVTTRADGGNSATDITARLDYIAGGSTSFVADTGEFDFETDLADMIGNVLIESTSGFRLRSDLIHARLSIVDVISPGPVQGLGPAGTLVAGTMRIQADETGQNTQMLFTSGVKLVYDPKETEEQK